MVVHEKGGNKVREQTFKFRSSTFIYAWNYPPIRFIFFFLFLCWRIRIPLSVFFFYFSRNSWSFSFSPILINFSSKIFIRFLQLKYFMRNISKLINIFRTSVSDLMTGTKSESFLCHDIYFYIFLCELRIERNLFLKLILYFHMAHFISGEKLTSLHCSKNEVGRNICVSSGHQKIVFLHCPSLIIYFLSSRKYFLIWEKNLYIS